MNQKDKTGFLVALDHRIRFIKSLFKWIHGEDFILKSPATKIKEPEIDHLREGYHTSMEKALFEFFI